MRCHFGHVVWGGALVALGSLFLVGCSATSEPPGAGEPVAKTQQAVTAAPAQGNHRRKYAKCGVQRAALERDEFVADHAGMG